MSEDLIRCFKLSLSTQIIKFVSFTKSAGLKWSFLLCVSRFSYRLFNQKRELEIQSIQPMDAGRYRCAATNEIGSLEVSVDMTVGGKLAGSAAGLPPCRIYQDFYIRIFRYCTYLSLKWPDANWHSYEKALANMF